MMRVRANRPKILPGDLTAGTVVFLVALPLCLGIALTSGAPLLAGVIAGIVGGVVVGAISGSQSSVSGPAVGMAAVIASQIQTLGFRAFLLAVVVAGLIQVALGVLRAGFLAAFVPSAVVKGLLAAIGITLVLKQIPHVLGHDADPEGDLAFFQANSRNTFTEIVNLLDDFQLGAMVIGLLSVAILIVWQRWGRTRRSSVPAQLVVVLVGVALNRLFRGTGSDLALEPTHLVQVPVAHGLAGLREFLSTPDFTAWANPAVYASALAIAAVASLQSLLNLEVVDQLDPQQRISPPSRELVAQGIGNIVSGLVGGLPVSSVVVRSSLNLSAGGRTKAATIVHGVLLLLCVASLPAWLNEIPLACLAAILLVAGARLARPQLARRMWGGGPYQFVPFVVTVAAIVLTDPLIGILVGLAVSAGFILHSNAQRPIRRVVEKHLSGEVVRIELANQVSFLNRATLDRALNEVPRDGRVLLDARHTDYIDPDILALIRDFRERAGPMRGIDVSLLGFRDKYELDDEIRYVDHATRELQSSLTPGDVLQILKDGHDRFRTGRPLTRNLGRQVQATADGQHPLAVILGCIDSRTPNELIFDAGVGDFFSVRIAGNVTSRKVLGSVEYACAVAGAKLVLVMGHTRCGAVGAAVKLFGSELSGAAATGCQHIDPILGEIQEVIPSSWFPKGKDFTPSERQALVDEVAGLNVLGTVGRLLQQSETLAGLVADERIAVVGAIYDVVTGDLRFLTDLDRPPVRASAIGSAS